MSDETNIPADDADDGPDANREYKDGMFRAVVWSVKFGVWSYE